MITVLVNGNPCRFTVSHFPDGSLNLGFEGCSFSLCESDVIEILWLKYTGDEELVELIYLVRYLRDKGNGRKCRIYLDMPYIPNARMDRVMNEGDVFTLKYFCEIINSLELDKVFVMDAHSNVSLGLLNNVIKGDVLSVIDSAVKFINDPNLILFFPDEGAHKRYHMGVLKDYHSFYGQKVRRWEDGKILGLDIRSEYEHNLDELNGATVLIVDDIISAGGTMYHSALKLKECGVDKIWCYTTHLERITLEDENSKMNQLLDDGTVEGILTYNNMGKAHRKVHYFQMFNNIPSFNQYSKF